MGPSNVIGFLSDFGTSDWYVGVVKAVIISINPSAQIIDITHEIPKQDILAGALALYACHRYFPDGSLILAVVDPGVGSQRDMLCVKTQRLIFLAPDNGILTLVLEHQSDSQIFKVSNERFFLKPVSKTFHARDILAPVAGHLSLGLDPSQVGPRCHNYTRISLEPARFDGKGLVLKVVWIDSFGNLITNCDNRLAREVVSVLGRDLRIKNRGKRLSVVDAYSEGIPGELIALEGSSGFLEIASFAGSASRLLNSRIGDELTLERS